METFKLDLNNNTNKTYINNTQINNRELETPKNFIAIINIENSQGDIFTQLFTFGNMGANEVLDNIDILVESLDCIKYELVELYEAIGTHKVIREKGTHF